MKFNSNLDVLRRMFELEKQIDETQDKLDYERSRRFSKPRIERKVVNRIYPIVKSARKYNWKLALLPFFVGIVFGIIHLSMFVSSFNNSFYLFNDNIDVNFTHTVSATSAIGIIAGFVITGGIIWFFYYTFFKYRKDKKLDEEMIRRSPAYQNHCNQLTRQYDSMQAEYDRQYEAETASREAEYGAWKIEKADNISKLENTLQALESELVSIYSEYRILPAQYHDPYALEFIVSMMESLEGCTLDQAIDAYEAHQQKRREWAMIHAQEDANHINQQKNRILAEQSDIFAEQADIMQEQADIAERTRRQEHRLGVIRVIQHHNTNKYLKKMSGS